jgi:hypothetical protein
VKKVYIAQLMCPERHCVVGMAGEFESQQEAEPALSHLLGLMFGEMVRGGVKEECGLCHATRLRVEVAPSRFRTMEEATPVLRELEERQRLTREFLQRSKS